MARTSPSAMIAPPDLPHPFDFPPFSEAMLRTCGKYEEVDIKGLILSGSNLPGLIIGPALISQVRAPGAKWRDLRITDTRISSCDAANADWTGASLQRVVILESRLTGANLSESRFDNVRLTRCKLDNAAFQKSTFNRCRFVGCDLRGADFEGADLRGVVFRGCDMHEARMIGIRAAGMDLRCSDVEGLAADIQTLRGAIIDHSQAAYLIQLCGLTIMSRPDLE